MKALGINFLQQIYFSSSINEYKYSNQSTFYIPVFLSLLTLFRIILQTIVLIRKMGTCANKKDVSEVKNDHQKTEVKQSIKMGMNQILGTKITESQLHESIDKLFDRFDTDHNNYLDNKEAAELLKASLGGKNVSPQEIDQIIFAADYNKNGKIQRGQLFDFYKQILC